jgi:PST family polysaccharide transporter
MTDERSDLAIGTPPSSAHGGFGEAVAGGAVIAVTSQGVQFAISVVSTMILARLLTPADYGVVGMVTVFIALAMVVREMGLSEATVQRSRISHEEVSALFWVNLALGVVLMVLLAIAAPAVAWFYQDARTAPLTLAYALGLPAAAVGVQHVALMRRRMLFGTIANVEIVSRLVGFAAAAILAANGAGYWALAVATVVEQSAYSVGAWRSSGWRPGPLRMPSGIRSLLTFGGDLTGFNLLNFVARNVDNLLVGRYWGADALGHYSRAYNLLLIPLRQINTPLGGVATPTLCRLADQPERYRQAYLRILEKVTAITMPMVTFLIVTSDWLIAILLGPQWREVSVLFALLGIGALFQPAANTTGWLFVSQNRTREFLAWGGMGGGILTLAIVAGLPWGARGVAASYAIASSMVVTPLLFWYVGRRGPVRVGDLWKSLIPALLSSAAVLGVTLLLRSHARLSPWQGLLTSAVLSVASAVIILAATRRGRDVLADLHQASVLAMRSLRRSGWR